MRLSTLYACAGLLAPLAVSAVPLARGIDKSTLTVLREFDRQSRSLRPIEKEN